MIKYFVLLLTNNSCLKFVHWRKTVFNTLQLFSEYRISYIATSFYPFFVSFIFFRSVAQAYLEAVNAQKSEKNSPENECRGTTYLQAQTTCNTPNLIKESTKNENEEKSVNPRITGRTVRYKFTDLSLYLYNIC